MRQFMWSVGKAYQIYRGLSDHINIWLCVHQCGLGRLCMQHVYEKKTKKHCPIQLKRPYGVEKLLRVSPEQLARATNKQPPPFSQHAAHCYYHTQPNTLLALRPRTCSVTPADHATYRPTYGIYTSWMLITMQHHREKKNTTFPSGFVIVPRELMKHMPCSHLWCTWPSLKHRLFQRRIFCVCIMRAQYSKEYKKMPSNIKYKI